MVYQGKLEYVILDIRNTIEVFRLTADEVIPILNMDNLSADFLISEDAKRNCEKSSESPESFEICHKAMAIVDNENAYQKWKNKELQVVPLGEKISVDSPYILENIEEHTPESLECIFLRLEGMPWHIAYTDRVLIREITLEDVPKLYDIYSDPRVSRFVEPLYDDIKEELEYTEKYIKNCYGFYEFGTWILEEKASGAIVGRAGLEPIEDRVELGYIIAGNYQGQGLATECCNSIMKIAQEILPEEPIWARCHVDNLISQKILNKLGFVVDREKSSQEGGNTKWYMKNL